MPVSGRVRNLNVYGHVNKVSRPLSSERTEERFQGNRTLSNERTTIVQTGFGNCIFYCSVVQHLNVIVVTIYYYFSTV